MNDSILETIAQEKKNLNNKPEPRIIDDPPDLGAKEKVEAVFEEYKKKLEAREFKEEGIGDYSDKKKEDSNDELPQLKDEINSDIGPDLKENWLNEQDIDPPEFNSDVKDDKLDEEIEQVLEKAQEVGSNDNAAFANQNRQGQNKPINQDDLDQSRKNEQAVADQAQLINDNPRGFDNLDDEGMDRKGLENLQGNGDHDIRVDNLHNQAQVQQIGLPGNEMGQDINAGGQVDNNIGNLPPAVEHGGENVAPNADSGSRQIQNVAPNLPVVKNPQHLDVDIEERLNKLPEKVNVELGWRPQKPIGSKKEHIHELPTLISAAADKDMTGVLQLVQSVQKFLPGEKLFIYDLGLTAENKRRVSK